MIHCTLLTCTPYRLNVSNYKPTFATNVGLNGLGPSDLTIAILMCFSTQLGLSLLLMSERVRDMPHAYQGHWLETLCLLAS